MTSNADNVQKTFKTCPIHGTSYVYSITDASGLDTQTAVRSAKRKNAVRLHSDKR